MKKNPEKWKQLQDNENFTFDKETQLAIVNSSDFLKDINNFYCINSPFEETQLTAVKRNRDIIKFISNPTENIQLAAVKEDGLVIQYIKNPSKEAQIEAVKNNGWAIIYINNPSEKIQAEAIKKDGKTIQFIENPSDEIQLESVKNNFEAIRFVPKNRQTPKIVEAFFEHSKEENFNCYFEFISEILITKQQAKIMIDCDPKSISFIPKKLQKEFL